MEVGHDLEALISQGNFVCFSCDILQMLGIVLRNTKLVPKRLLVKKPDRLTVPILWLPFGNLHIFAKATVMLGNVPYGAQKILGGWAAKAKIIVLLLQFVLDVPQFPKNGILGRARIPDRVF